MTNSEADRLWGVYLKAKAEFERIAHSGTIMSDEYGAARDHAKAALQHYNDFTARKSSS